jgi:hypothetical protein
MTDGYLDGRTDGKASGCGVATRMEGRSRCRSCMFEEAVSSDSFWRVERVECVVDDWVDRSSGLTQQVLLGVQQLKKYSINECPRCA